MQADLIAERGDEDMFCPHTAYPLQVTLTLIEGDMTVRHTECGRTVLTDWPYLRATDVPLELAYAIDDQDEDWLELRLVRPDDQQPTEATGGEQVQDGAAADPYDWDPVYAAATIAGLQKQLAAGLARAESATVLPERWRALIAERDAAVRRAEEAEAWPAELGKPTIEWTVTLDGTTGSPLPEKLARRMSRHERTELMTRTAYRNPPWQRVAEAADAAQEARSATETVEDGVQASGSELEFEGRSAGLCGATVYVDGEEEICARPPHGDDTNHAHDPFAGIEGDDTTEDDRG